MIIWLILAGLYAFHLLLRLHWITTLVIGVFLLLRLPYHRRLYRKQQEELRRFGEVSEYMDTLLYAFAREQKVERALVDTEAAMLNGSMRELLREAIDHLHMTFDDSDVMRDSLRIIERDFNCRRLENIHAFMVQVEQFGGEISHPVDLLLEDKSRWEKRIRFAREERSRMFSEIVMSIAASLLICAIILYLPVMDMDISGNVVAQIMTVVVVVLDDWILSRGQRYLAADWLTMDTGGGKDEEKRIRDYYHYDEKKDRRLSMLLCAGTGVLTAFCFWRGKQAFGAAGLLLMVLMANQHRVGRNLARKNLVKSVKCAFPVWLMDLILLLQSENVQVALQKSQEHVPGILARDLQLLTDRLELEPESAEPYHRFMQEFQIPEVHAAMSMLFSLSIGNSGQADRQIGELIVQNLEMLDAVERERLHDLNSGMYLLFLAPIMTASLKLLVDMALFMMSFLGGIGAGG